MAKRAKTDATRIYVGQEDFGWAVKWADSDTPNLDWPVAPQVTGLVSVLLNTQDRPIRLVVDVAGDAGPGVAKMEELHLVTIFWCDFVQTTCQRLSFPTGRWGFYFGEGGGDSWRACYTMIFRFEPNLDFLSLCTQTTRLAEALYGYRAGLAQASAVE